MLMNSHANHHWAFTWANPRWNAHRHCHARAHACAHVSSVCGGGCVRVARPPRTTGVSQHQQPPSEKACARDVHEKTGLDAKATPLAQPRPGTMQGHHVVGTLCEPRRGALPRAASFLISFPLSSPSLLLLSPSFPPFFSSLVASPFPSPCLSSFSLPTRATETVCPLVAVGALCVPWATGGVIGGNPGLGAHPSN